ncbi:MAG: hypothetical protein WCI11_15565 [Candidatus Methylumidiphilus sp.]
MLSQSLNAAYSTPSFRHGLPEPSHREVNIGLVMILDPTLKQLADYPPWHWIPAVHGGMTAV